MTQMSVSRIFSLLKDDKYFCNLVGCQMFFFVDLKLTWDKYENQFVLKNNFLQILFNILKISIKISNHKQQDTRQIVTYKSFMRSPSFAN